MAFEDLKENLKNQFEQMGERITNSRLYGLLLEKYENLSSVQQKIAKIIGALLVLGLFVYFPMDYFSISFENTSSFEEKRQLIKDIIRSEREISSMPDIPRPLPAESVKSNIESQLRELQFLPEQIKKVSINSAPTSDLIPQNKLQYGIEVSIEKINVKQLTNLGSKLQIIHPAVKVKDMIISLNRQDPRYLDAEFKLVALNIPEYQPPLPPPPETKKKGKKTTKTEDGE